MPKDMRGIMEEFKEGTLHSGSSSGPVVKNRKQAIAIGLSEARKMGSPGAKMALEKYTARTKGRVRRTKV